MAVLVRGNVGVGDGDGGVRVTLMVIKRALLGSKRDGERRHNPQS